MRNENEVAKILCIFCTIGVYLPCRLTMDLMHNFFCFLQIHACRPFEEEGFLGRDDRQNSLFVHWHTNRNNDKVYLRIICNGGCITKESFDIVI
jgi:hypothetical protein